MEHHFYQDDIPYSTLQEDKTGYQILLLREQQNQSFTAIASQLGVSPARVRQQYTKMKVRQVRLYLRHIAIVLGHENTAQVRKEFSTAMECYQNYPYACGYLDKTYGEILESYRAGEPGTPQEMLEKLPPCPVKLGKEEISRIVTMREEGNASFRAIGREFHITPEKARHTYEMVYHHKVLEYVEGLQQQAKSWEERMEIWRRYFGGHQSAKTRYEKIQGEIEKQA